MTWNRRIPPGRLPMRLTSAITTVAQYFGYIANTPEAQFQSAWNDGFFHGHDRMPFLPEASSLFGGDIPTNWE